MKIVKIDGQNFKKVIAQAVSILKAGGIVIYPTETCYGVGADATNQQAVDKILKYKSKRKGKPMSVAVTDQQMASKYVEVNETAENIYTNLLPGPITVVSNSLHKVAQGVESPEGTLGIRIPDNKIIMEIVKEFGKPVTSTSANASYKKTPYKISDILDNLSPKQKSLVDLIIDAGELPPNPPSTVIDTTLNEYTVLRQGKIKFGSEEKTTTHTAVQTQELGYKLMQKYRHYLGYKSVIFAMQGELGTGKTQFAKGVAQALGVKESISSPTYIIESNYEIEKPEGSYLASRNVEFIHIDTWRLKTGDELLELDFLSQVDNCNVFVIEWADKISSILENVKADAVLIWIELNYIKDQNSRQITISY